MNVIARVPFPACPLCGGVDATLVASADCSQHPLYQPQLPATMRWVRCSGCRHVFTEGYFDDNGLLLLMRSTHPGQTPGNEVLQGRAISAKIVETVTALRYPTDAAAPGRWLDVGFGNGALLTTAAEFGYAALGVDMREGSVRMLREFGFAAFCADFCRFSPPDGPLDVISMADVLEHMPYPDTALRHAHGLLAPRGLIFLSMPNIDSFLWRHLDRAGQNPYWAELEHYHNFGRQRLYTLLRACGFEPLHYGISGRYVACMEVVARRIAMPAPLPTTPPKAAPMTTEDGQ